MRHRRARPFVYNLEHGVTYLALDLDELDGIENAAWLIRRNPAWPPRDPRRRPPRSTGRGPRAAVDHLRAAGEDPAGWQVTLVTNPRVLGYVFNPASFYLCRDPEGVLRIVIVEVHNTHGERHLYTLRPRPGGDSFVAAMDKVFYVSPFLETRGGYTVRVRDEPTRLRIAINHEAAEGLLLHTSLDLARRPLTARSVVRMLVRYPLVTHRTTLMIHWHALRLWLRGARFHRHREAAR